MRNEENQRRIELMKELIRMRKTHQACRSLYFHFPNEYENRRCVEYVKLDEAGKKLEVILNCSEEEIEIHGTGEVLFSRNYQAGRLGAKGTLVRSLKI